MIRHLDPNFHRPLSMYINETVRLGGEVYEVVEPRLDPVEMESPGHELLTRVPNFIVILEPFVRRQEIGARTMVALGEVPSYLLTWQPQAVGRLLPER